MAGGGALISQGLVDRLTRDLDYFGAPGFALSDFAPQIIGALVEDGLEVEVKRQAATFYRLAIKSADNETELDLAIDARLFPLVQSDLGWVLSPLELASEVHFNKDGPMESENANPIVTVFRSRLHQDAEANGYGELAVSMEVRARAMPGFVDFKSFSSSDGERLSVIVFDTIGHQHAWRDDSSHRIAQQRGRDNFYSEYSISVCQELGQRSFQDAELHQPVNGEESPT